MIYYDITFIYYVINILLEHYIAVLWELSFTRSPKVYHSSIALHL
jgi:hypothetical protein